MKNALILTFLILLPTLLMSQSHTTTLTSEMEAYEIDIQNTYNEYQKVYYERKSSKNELKAFEDIISVYVSQILEIYETLTLSSTNVLEKPRDIAARALIFRALTYLEKAPLNVEFYEKACYDYYSALEMYDDSDQIPVVLKPLPQPVRVGNQDYTRLIDLIEKKGKELYSFGKVKIILKNFKITSNLNAESFGFFRFTSPFDKKKYTYNEAETLIKNAFDEVLIKNGTTTCFLALPEGSYFIRSKQINDPLYPYMSALYVRGNQQQEYIIEPIVDWIIMYENPKARQPNFYKNNQSQRSSSKSGRGDGNGEPYLHKKKRNLKNDPAIMNAIEDAVVNCIEKIDIEKIFNLRDPWIRSRFTNVATKIIDSYISSTNYYNCWSQWMIAWEISISITNAFSPGNTVPTELVQLVYDVLQKF